MREEVTPKNILMMGPTGCGKTTFLNLLTRIYMPSKGDLLIDGESADPKKHNLAFVFQEPSSIPWKTVEENLELFKEIWPPIIKLAEEKGVKVAIENCPMLFGADQWPGGQNLFTTPRLWRKMFELLPSDNFGINYDPSHFIWQQIDYIKPLYEFRDKIFHVHFKDIKLFKDKLDDVGIMGYPLDFMSPKLPGLGDVDWGKYVSALTDIGYDGYACIEVEDKAFEGSKQRVMDSVALSCRYMRQFVI